MNTNYSSNTWKTIALFLLVIVIVLSTYIASSLSANSIKSTTVTQDSQVPTGPLITDTNEIQSFIQSFMGAIQSKNATKVISMFTLPVTQEEKDTLDNMNGKKPDVGMLRLFNNVASSFSITDWKILTITRITSDKYTVVVDETIKNMCQTGDCPDGSTVSSGLTHKIEIVRNGSSWLVDKYYPTEVDLNHGTVKYLGLGF